MCKIPLPAGLSESAKLEKPLFTPSTKAEIGEHGRLSLESTFVCVLLTVGGIPTDENISPEEGEAQRGAGLERV